MVALVEPLLETLPWTTHAVVMGDLVSSEDTASVEGLHASFNAAIQGANDAHRREIVSPLTITLGDEFQGLCATLEGGLRIVRDLRARLLSGGVGCRLDRKSTRLNSSHVVISYAVFCLTKKRKCSQ